MWPWKPGKDRQRQQALKRLADNRLKEHYSIAFPPTGTRLREASIVALDLETTGLDANLDQILSIGVVSIDTMAVDLNTARHQLICAAKPVPASSAVIHGITDDLAATGKPLSDVLPELLGQLEGKVLLVHHAATEQAFLNRACRDLYGGDFIAPLIDTEQLARRSFEKRHTAYKPRDLRLFNLRRRYGLPEYAAHNALSDALATAELFLALAANLQPDLKLRLSDVLSA